MFRHISLLRFLKFFPILIILQFDLPATGQSLHRPEIAGNYPNSVFVVTDRKTDTLKNGGLIYTNIVDTSKGLKFLKVIFEDDTWYGESYTSLDELLKSPAPYKDWAVWVHGDGQAFLPSMKEALEIQYLHQVNFIVFSWPTKAPDKGPIANFRNSKRNALLTAPYLEEMCHILEDYTNQENNKIKGEHLSIFFHSLGNYMLEKIVEEGYLEDIEKGLFDNLVINEAAAESKNHDQWVEKLDIQKRLYIDFNSGDKNLILLRILTNLGLQLGERPVAPLAGNAIYVDFTEAVGSKYRAGTTHSYYYARITGISQNIRKYFYDLFHGRAVDFNDPDCFESTENSQVFRIKF